MCAQRQNSARFFWRHPGRRSRGFALLEMAFATLIVLLGTGVVLTAVGRMRQRQNCAVYIQDLRVFSAAFARYHQQHNRWPPSTNAEIAVPPDLAKALKETHWSGSSPFGGSYAWVAPDPAGTAGHGPAHGWGTSGAVTLTSFSPGLPLTVNKSDLLQIDRQIDDGNLATGRFRTGFNGWPVFLVEAAQR